MKIIFIQILDENFAVRYDRIEMSSNDPAIAAKAFRMTDAAMRHC